MTSEDCNHDNSSLRRMTMQRRWIDVAADMAIMLTAVRQIELSKRRMEIEKSLEAIAQAPHMREDLVSSVAEQIESGCYCITGADILPRMIRDHAMDPMR